MRKRSRWRAFVRVARHVIILAFISTIPTLAYLADPYRSAANLVVGYLIVALAVVLYVLAVAEYRRIEARRPAPRHSLDDPPEAHHGPHDHFAYRTTRRP